MIQAIRKVKIRKRAVDVWQLVSAFGMGCQYLSEVERCTVLGEGVGAMRTLFSANGDQIVERMDMLDGEAYRLRYTLLSDTPFRNCVTTMVVRDLNMGMTEVEWSAVFEAEGLPAGEAAELMESALAKNCNALKQFLEE